MLNSSMLPLVTPIIVLHIITKLTPSLIINTYNTDTTLLNKLIQHPISPELLLLDNNLNLQP